MYDRRTLDNYVLKLQHSSESVNYKIIESDICMIKSMGPP